MTRSTDFTLADLVFDVEEHSSTTRNRLLSAADFILKYEFDDPYKQPPRVDPQHAMVDPLEYFHVGNGCYEKFLCAKLMSINMIYLEDAVTKSFPDGIYSDEELRLAINEFLMKKENDDKTKGRRTRPYGTRLNKSMIKAGMKVEFRRGTPERLTKCCICLSYLDGPIKNARGEILDSENYGHVIGTLINCGHEFHNICITDWLLSNDNGQCPVCRQWALLPQYEYPSWINDLNKVGEFLSRNHLSSFEGERRYIITVSVLHAIMAHYLRDHGMQNVLEAFLDRVQEVMGEEREDFYDDMDEMMHKKDIERKSYLMNDMTKEEMMYKKRILNEAIKYEVVDFLKCCRNYKKDRPKLLVRFNKFIKTMLEDLGLHSDEFDNNKLDGELFELSSYLCAFADSLVYAYASK